LSWRAAKLVDEALQALACNRWPMSVLLLAYCIG
jgi:hypothetical protein